VIRATSFGVRHNYYHVLCYSLLHLAIGCPDIEAPSGGWVRRNGNLLTAGCDDKQRTWHLTCDGVTWVGQIGDCEVPGERNFRSGSLNRK